MSADTLAVRPKNKTHKIREIDVRIIIILLQKDVDRNEDIDTKSPCAIFIVLLSNQIVFVKQILRIRSRGPLTKRKRNPLNEKDLSVFRSMHRISIFDL